MGTYVKYIQSRVESLDLSFKLRYFPYVFSTFPYIANSISRALWKFYIIYVHFKSTYQKVYINQIWAQRCNLKDRQETVRRPLGDRHAMFLGRISRSDEWNLSFLKFGVVKWILYLFIFPSCRGNLGVRSVVFVYPLCIRCGFNKSGLQKYISYVGVSFIQKYFSIYLWTFCNGIALSTVCSAVPLPICTSNRYIPGVTNTLN